MASEFIATGDALKPHELWRDQKVLAGVRPDAPKTSVFSGYGDSLISLQFYSVIFRYAIECFGDKAHPNVYKTVFSIFCGFRCL
jgi:hypothetical protein